MQMWKSTIINFKADKELVKLRDLLNFKKDNRNWIPCSLSISSFDNDSNSQPATSSSWIACKWHKLVWQVATNSA